MVSSGQPLAAQPELPLPGARDAALANEQEHVDRMYARLDGLRLHPAAADEAPARSGRAVPPPRVPNAMPSPLSTSAGSSSCAEWRTGCASVGLICPTVSVTTSGGWACLTQRRPAARRLACPAAQAFYRATSAEPLGVRRRRHLQLPDAVVGVGDDVLDVDRAGRTRPRLDRSTALRRGHPDGRSCDQPDRPDVRHRRHHPVRAGPHHPGRLARRSGRTGRSRHRQDGSARSTAPRTCSMSSVSACRSGRPAWSGPTSTFLRYIEQVLPSLGETGVLLATPEELLPVSRSPRRSDQLRGAQGRRENGRRHGPRSTTWRRCRPRSRLSLSIATRNA